MKLRKYIKYLTRNLDRADPLILLFTTLLFLYFPFIILDLIVGASRLKPWQFGLFYVPTLLIVYYIFKKSISGIKSFLIILFFSFLAYPTTSYYLYKYNSNNYKISNEFLEIEKDFAKEIMSNKLTIQDLQLINSTLKVTSKYNPVEIHLPDTIKFEYKDIFKINGRKTQVRISKFDTIQTTLTYRDEFIPSKYSANPNLIYAINSEIEYLESLTKMLGKSADSILFSEFWIEAIVGFSAGHISPARNFTKVLNAMQLVSLLFLSTILINSVSGELVMKRKGNKKGKKK